MPVHLPAMGRLGLKVVTVVPDNPGRGLPTIQALVSIFDAATGSPLAVMDGEVLTAIRTGAASGVATELLARPDAAVAAVIGAGAQGRRQIEAVCCVRPIREVLIFDADPENALRFAQELGDELAFPVRVLHRVSAIADADVICTATSSDTPVLLDRDVAPGTHINAIGAYRPNTREIPGQTVARSRLVVDSRPACMAEAGELVMAINEGLLDAGFQPSEIGEVAAGLHPGRENSTEVTLFKSVGNAVQDLAVAGVVLDEARRLGLGTEVKL
jgi:ornithine cyclodeaminase/alanine dehydrogenase-like protein (mu-crystallin family)